MSVKGAVEVILVTWRLCSGDAGWRGKADLGAAEDVAVDASNGASDVS